MAGDESTSRLPQQQGVFSRQTHQILANKNPDKKSEEDAADEPEDPEGVELLRVGPSVLGRLLIGQLTPQFHGIVKARQVLLQASARGAADVVRSPLSPRPLPHADELVVQRAPGQIAAVGQRRASSLWGGAVGAAAVARGLRQEGRRSL